MSLFQKIESELKAAMLSQAKERLSALRNMKTALKNKAIDLKRDLNDEEVIQTLSTLAKQRKESIESFQKAQRDDLVAKEEAELKVLQEFMPQALSESELDGLIKKTIEELKATSPKDMGAVMKALKPQVTGRADGKVVSEKVKKALMKS